MLPRDGPIISVSEALCSPTSELGPGQLSFPADALRFGRRGRKGWQVITRSAQNAPQLPTIDEFGIPDCQAIPWFGLLAPAGTLAPIVGRLYRKAAKVVAQRRRQSVTGKHVTSSLLSNLLCRPRDGPEMRMKGRLK
jgi:hypothetical protein